MMILTKNNFLTKLSVRKKRDLFNSNNVAQIFLHFLKEMIIKDLKYGRKIHNFFFNLLNRIFQQLLFL